VSKFWLQLAHIDFPSCELLNDWIDIYLLVTAFCLSLFGNAFILYHMLMCDSSVKIEGGLCTDILSTLIIDNGSLLEA